MCFLLFGIEEHLDLTLLTCFKYNNKQGEEQRVFIIDDMAPKWKRVGRMLKFNEAQH